MSPQPCRPFCLGAVLIAAMCLLPLCAARASAQQLRPDYGRVPLAFEANSGQTDPRVKFLNRGDGYALFLTATEAVLSLQGSTDHGATLRMAVVGANPRPAITPEQLLPGRSNYFIGDDPRQWRTNVRTYSRVKYASVYPGIDLVYYGNQRQLEYDFVVTPGADPNAIALRFDGADSMRLDGSGNLVLAIGDEQVVQQRPSVYQESGGRRTTVDARYVLRGGRVVFDVAAYDRSRPLVIDPVLRYSTFIGGNGDFGPNEMGAAGVAVDSSGNAYVVGSTKTSDFPITAGALQPTATRANVGAEIAFVTKFNASGTAQIYSTYFGNGATQGTAIAVDHLGQAYITGNVVNLIEMPGSIPVVNGFQATSSLDVSFTSGFMAKLDSTGSGLLYSSYVGGDRTSSIAVDNAGYAYVSGVTGDAPVTTKGAFSTTGDAFVMKIDTLASGDASLKYSTRLGGYVNQGLPVSQPNDRPLPVAVAIDASGSVYVAGTAAGQEGWPTTPGAFDSSYNSDNPEGPFLGDIFVMKLNPAGNGVVYFTFVGSGMWDGAGGIAVDSVGNAYVGGMSALFEGYESSSSNIAAFPTTPGAYRTAPYRGDAYSQFHGVVFKLNADGSDLIYSTHLGGSAFDLLGGIVIDEAGRASVAGSTSSEDFPVTPDALQTARRGSGTRNGYGDLFVTTLSADGSTLEYSTFFGSSQFEIGAAIAGGANGDLYVTGLSFGGDPTIGLPVTPGAFRTTPSPDGILFKLGPAPPKIAPMLAAGAATVAVAEGQTAANAGTFNDPDSANVTLTASIGTIQKNGSASGTWSWLMPAGNGPAVPHVVITADDGEGGVTTTAFDVLISNVAPTASASGPVSRVLPRQAFTLNGAWTDPATAADGPYSWSWTPVTPAVDGAGHALQATSGSSAYGAAIPYVANIKKIGTYSFRFRVTDKDGTSSDAIVTVTVRAPTHAELRALVQSFSRNPGVAVSLLARLVLAASAPTAAARGAQLDAFVAVVRAQIGHAFTQDQADILIAFADALR